MAYTPKTWVAGEVITAADLNDMEAGIDDAHAGNIDPGAIGEAELASNAVTAVKIANSAVTPAKTSFWLGGNATAIYAGKVSSAGAAVSLPSGWSCNKETTGLYRITHGLGSANVFVLVTPDGAAARAVAAASSGANTVDVVFLDTSGALADAAFSFALFRY